MPRYYPGPLGTPIGKLKDAVVRRVNGKLFYSIRPEKYKISQSTLAKNSRTAFAVTVQFARRVASITQLAYCWKKAKVKGTSAYHRILKYNLPLTSNGFLTVENKMLPQYPGIVLKASMDDLYNLIVDIDFSGSELIDCTGKASLHYLIALSINSKDASAFDFIEKTTFIDIEHLKGHFTTVIEPSQSERASFKKFRKFILFTSISANDSKGKTICISAKALEFIKNVDSKNSFQIV